jgi:NADH-quinone oxidoreductase subunit N
MEIPIPSLDLLIVAPEIVVLVTALLVMMADLALKGEQKGRLAWLALVGVAAAAILSFYLWDGSDPVLQGMLAADGYGLFLNLVLLAAAALAILLSLDGSFPPLLAVGLGFMVAGFGFKVALVPFHMWTPDVYQGAPTSIAAFMSVGAKVAGFAALGRVVLYAFGEQFESWSWLLAGLAALTMTVGNLAALRQANVKRLLAYSSIAHAGYILVGLAAANEAGAAAVLFYLFVYAFMNIGAFAVVLASERLASAPGRGEPVTELAGLTAGRRWPAVAMALFMLSLAGVPPLAGFLGKLYVFGAAVQGGLAWLAALGVVNSVISAYYYLRVVAAMAWPERMHTAPAGIRVPRGLQAAVALAALAVVVLGLWPGPVLDLARMAALAIWGG